MLLLGKFRHNSMHFVLLCISFLFHWSMSRHLPLWRALSSGATHLTFSAERSSFLSLQFGKAKPTCVAIVGRSIFFAGSAAVG